MNYSFFIFTFNYSLTINKEDILDFVLTLIINEIYKFFKELYEDAKNIQKKDPAAKNILEVIILYPGFHILVFHKISHWLYKHKLFFLARLNSRLGRFFTGIEMHPGAKIGRINNYKKEKEPSVEDSNGHLSGEIDYNLVIKTHPK